MDHPRLVPTPGFQSSPAPEGRCYLLINFLCSSSLIIAVFQSSPAPEGRCYRACQARRAPTYSPVSILTGPGRPVLRRSRAPRTPGGSCFNPHRPRKAGATSETPLVVKLVSGQTADALDINTSTGSGGNVLFQSSPAPEGRCYEIAREALRRLGTAAGFNPHRPRKAGATLPRGVVRQVIIVSILTGPGRPVLRFRRGHTGRSQGFQSSPAPEGRCYGRFQKRIPPPSAQQSRGRAKVTVPASGRMARTSWAKDKRLWFAPCVHPSTNGESVMPGGIAEAEGGATW